MKQRKWAAEEKMAIIMEGLKGNKSISDICREHKISQGLYYQWRDRFLEGGKKALAAHGIKDDVYKTEIAQSNVYKRNTILYYELLMSMI